MRLALLLIESGFNQSRTAQLTGIPRSTIRSWINRPSPKPKSRIDPLSVPRREYAYLLGVYLGDGYICRMARTYRLRIAMDSRYPGIIEEVRSSISAVLAPNKGSVQRFRDKNMVEVSGYSRWLPTLFPQHGPGPKHARLIRLEPWQEEIVDENPEPFIRGLLHSDGCRVTNRVWGGKYEYPRYFFSQVSTDIMELFCRTCRQLGIQYRFNNPRSVSVARRASVARLDEFVGPKS